MRKNLHPYEDVSEIAKERAKEKAEFCLATGVQPSEYENLTQLEIAAFIDQANKNANKK